MFHYKFPEIKTIDDVRWAIEDCPEIIEAVRDDYTVLNYIVSTDTTFPNVHENLNGTLRRECRGLIFDKEGKLISRPFHKFFNVSEKEETQLLHLDLSKPHHILQKLDGSMVRPLYINDKWRLATKMGVTDVALQAEEFIKDKPNYIQFFLTCREQNLTPIFEWVSRKQRIVIDYVQDNLILTALRGLNSGNYIEYGGLRSIAKAYHIPVVQEYAGTVESMEHLLEHTETLEGEEGYVIRFHDGMMVKIKGSWYVRIHKAKDMINREKNIVDLIINEKLDDVKPFLLEEDLRRLNQYEHNFWTGIKAASSELNNIFTSCSRDTASRKDFAIHVQKQDILIRPLLFKMYDGKITYHIILDKLKSSTSTQKKLDECRSLFRANWNYEIVE
jgi:RNA ligase